MLVPGACVFSGQAHSHLAEFEPTPWVPNDRSASHRHHPRLALPKSSTLTTTSSRTPPGPDSLPFGISGPAKNHMGKRTQFSPERATDRLCRRLTLSCCLRSVFAARPRISASDMSPNTGPPGIALVKPHPRTLVGWGRRCRIQLAM